MPLTLVKEDGTGSSNANSYANAADGDAYHEGHLYASAWTDATTAKKEAALVMATRLIDSCYQFNGFKVSNDQALQWPRKRAMDPDRAFESGLSVLNSALGPYFDEDTIPKNLVDAACELARELIKSDTTDAPEGEGVSQVSVTGVMHVQFDKKDRQQQIPLTTRLMLSKLGSYKPKSSNVRLIRV
jgi:hypothetical protein